MAESKGAELVPTRKLIVGDPDHVSMVLRTQDARGRLVTDPSTIVPRPVSGGRFAVEVDLLLPKAPAVREATASRLATWDREHPVASPVMKALAFVAVLGLAAAAMVTALVIHLRGLFDDVNGAAVLGGVAVAVFLLLLAGSRLNHAGACPGVVVHCKGCR